jgi:hypothetical protein
LNAELIRLNFRTSTFHSRAMRTSLFPDRPPEGPRAKADSILNKIVASDGRRESKNVLISSWALRLRSRTDASECPNHGIRDSAPTQNDDPRSDRRSTEKEWKEFAIEWIGGKCGQDSVHISASGNSAAAAEFENRHKDENGSKSI